MASPKDFQFKIELGNGITVSEIAITIYSISDTNPQLLDSRLVTAACFTVPLLVTGRQYLYAVAEIQRFALNGTEVGRAGGRIVQMVSVFSDAADAVVLSEQLTVATAYSFARFIKIDAERKIVISAPNRALNIAYGMKNNFVETKGAVAKVMSSSPNGLETNSYALFNFLSNLLYYGLTVPEVYDSFVQLTAARSLFDGLFTLARVPFTEVEAIYALISDRVPIYTPSLPSLVLPEGASPVPEQWTLTIKVNDSGAQNFLIGGVAYMVFDKNDRAWITNNVRQGTPNSATFCVILEPDGSPAPFSPLFGGGLLGGGFGAATDLAGEKIYLGNFGWGPTEYNPQTGSISVFTHEGKILSPVNGYTNQLSRVQGMNFDSQGNLWMCSWGSQEPFAPADSRYHFDSSNSAVVVYLQGNPEQALIYSFDSPYYQTFDVITDSEGNAFVSNGGNSKHGVISSVYKFRIENGSIRKLAQWESNYVDTKKSGKNGYEGFKQICLNGQGEVFVAGASSNRVVKLDQDLNYLAEFTGNIHAPWGITFDSCGVMYVANFSNEMTVDVSISQLRTRAFGVTVIRNEDDSTAKLMTLPTGGAEVTLANGLPLYGNPETSTGANIPLHSYDPLMRLTSTRVDRAGNLWALNNWKPSLGIDLVKGNPGGDGVVIFVGVAEPVTSST